MFKGKKQVENILHALAEQLKAEGRGNFELVVCGGVALNALGYVKRATQDVDIVAFVKKEKGGLNLLSKANESIMSDLKTAAERVRRDFDLKEGWLNIGPASVMDIGFPEGLMERVQTRSYGDNLTIHFLGRYDQIHFKLYAALTSERRVIHLSDLFALNPTKEEIRDAARWIMGGDTAGIYKQTLRNLLNQIGLEDVAGEF